MGTHALRLCERRRAGAVNRAENHFSRDGFTSTSFCSAASTSMDCCGHAGAVHSGALNTTFRTMITHPRRGDPPAASTSPRSWARCEPGMRADPDRASAHATPPPIPLPHSTPSPRPLNESDPGPSCAQRSTKPAITAHPNGTENAGYGPSRDRKLPCGRASVSRETFPPKCPLSVHRRARGTHQRARRAVDSLVAQSACAPAANYVRRAQFRAGQGSAEPATKCATEPTSFANSPGPDFRGQRQSHPARSLKHPAPHSGGGVPSCSPTHRAGRRRRHAEVKTPGQRCDQDGSSHSCNQEVHGCRRP